MKILFLGDIVARSGRRIVREFVPKLREEYGIDVVIANGENARHGRGISLETYQDLMASGVDYLTSGDHIWADQEFVGPLSQESTKVLRPANYPQGVPGRGMATINVNGEPLTIMNLQGQVFMHANLENPFHTFDALLPKAKGFIFVDFHAEATSEKNSMGHYLDGRAGAVVGTHTHVQTADERVLPGGTAYISDAGMCGPLNGSIGADFSGVMQSFLQALPFKYEPASGPAQLNGVLIETDGERAKSIERVQRFLE